MAQTILILAANPKGTSQLRLDQEVRDIGEGLQRAKHREEFILEQKWAVRPRDIQRAMLDINPQIIHFSGHGTGDEGLAFEDEVGQPKLVDGEALAGLFELFADQVECAVLNGCYSEVQATAIAQHVNYVIGMKKAIGDQAAIEFVVGFYDALGAGKPVEFAYKLGCAAIRLAGIPEQLTPVLKKKPNIDEPIVKINLSKEQPAIKKEVEQELNDSEQEKLKKLLNLSGRASALRRNALCKEIAINPGEISNILALSEHDFAVELIDLLLTRKLESSTCKLCNKLKSDFQGGSYISDLATITAKLNC